MTPEDLKALIASDPEAAELFAKPDDEGCAARCRAIAPPLRRPIAAEVLRRATQATGVWGKMRLAAQRDATPDQLRAVLITFIDRMRQNEDLNFDEPAVRQMAAGLVAAGVVTQQQVDEIDAMANHPAEITGQDVERIRMGWV